MRARPEVLSDEAEFMGLWNAYVQGLASRLVSDRMLPAACRGFAAAHAPSLRRGAPLHRSFRAHLTVLWQHNLLHRDDVHDCLLLLLGAEGGAVAQCRECTRPLHESHCALAARARGAAAWPSGNNSAARDPAVLAAAVRPVGGGEGGGAGSTARSASASVKAEAAPSSKSKKWAVVEVGPTWSEDGTTRLCGTPGCTYLDHHDGPCSNAVPLSKRPRN